MEATKNVFFPTGNLKKRTCLDISCRSFCKSFESLEIADIGRSSLLVMGDDRGPIIEKFEGRRGQNIKSVHIPKASLYSWEPKFQNYSGISHFQERLLEVAHLAVDSFLVQPGILLLCCETKKWLEALSESSLHFFVRLPFFIWVNLITKSWNDKLVWGEFGHPSCHVWSFERFKTKFLMEKTPKELWKRRKSCKDSLWGLSG